MLKGVVLIRANGERTPAALEAERQATTRGMRLDIAFWNSEREVDHRDDRIIAYDKQGVGHTIARKANDENVVTKAGRRFYAEAPHTEWIVHIQSYFADHTLAVGRLISPAYLRHD